MRSKNEPLRSEESCGGKEPLKEGLPVGEEHEIERGPHMIPQVAFAPELLPKGLIGLIGELEYLVHEEGKEVQKEEVEGEMPYPMAEVVFEMVALIL